MKKGEPDKPTFGLVLDHSEHFFDFPNDVRVSLFQNDDFEFLARDIAFHDRAEEQWPADQAGAKSISAISYNSGSPPTLTVTVTPISGSGHGLTTGDTVVIQDVVPAGYNGEYVVTVIDTNNFTATLPTGTADPGRYISAITWSSSSGGRATVTSTSHGLSTGNTVVISGAVPGEYNGTRTITFIDANSYRYNLALAFAPGTMSPGIAAAKALTPNAKKLSNTTRAMSQLDSAYSATVQDTAIVYDEQKSTCAGTSPACPTGQSCGSDNMCYQPAFQNLRLGFTLGERASSSTTSRGELIEITSQATTWLP